MSFIDSIGVLMARSCLKEILSSKFAGAENIFRKKFPMNLMTHKLVAIELLRGHKEETDFYDELER